ncbi:hypothetical protein [Mycobacterium sp. NPDC050853]|uniref:hypothetical protein n=1 Tax=Mycobacterium sp. NPDC050853 TaxID=3155160 RepID=UPI0033F49925
MDRTANPLFKAGMAAIAVTTLVVAPTVIRPAPHAISLPDIRSASIRLSSFAFTPRVADTSPSAVRALRFALPPVASEAANVSTNPHGLAPITQLAPSVSPRTAAAQSPAAIGAPSRSGISAAVAPVPGVANSITNGIDQAYQFIQYWVDYGVDLAQWGAGFVPVIGGLVSAQIGIVYDNLVRPIANSFVYNLVNPIINDPSFSNIVNSFGQFGGAIVNSVINFAWAEARYFLPPLPPLPGLAAQAAPNAVSALPADIHEALAPITKAIKDAQAHFADALGLPKIEHALVSAEKPATEAETTTEPGTESAKDSTKEDVKNTATSVASDTRTPSDTQAAKDSAEATAHVKDKNTGAVANEEKTKEADKEDVKDAAADGTQNSPKDGAPSGAVIGAKGSPGETTKGTTPTKDTGDAKDSGKDAKPPAGVVTKVKPKVPAPSTTEHGTVSAQGTVRGSASQSTTGQSTTGKSDSPGTTSSGPSSSASKSSAATTPDTTTKVSDTKTSDTKSAGTTSTHDSTSKPSGAASSSPKSGGDGSKSGAGSHD